MHAPPAPSGSLVVQVALPVPVDTLFDYALDPELAPQAEPGRRVLVPFGTRRLTGVIVSRPEASSSPPRRELRRVERILDAEPVVSSAMLEVLREAARDALCPLGVALTAAMPPGSAPRSELSLALTAAGRDALAAGAARGAVRAVLEALAGGPRSRRSLHRIPASAAAVRALRRDGLVGTVLRERAPARFPTLRVVRVADGVDPEAAVAGPLARAPKQAELLRRVARCGPVELASLSAASPGATGLVQALRRRGLVQVEERPAARPPPRAAELEEPLPERLTPEQQSACEAIGAAVRSRCFETFLVHGVTGSGKTEVYLRAIAEALEIGRQALVLVPEITLTHQLVARLRQRFGDRLAVLHSGLRPAERLEEWRRLRAGATPIAAGARSALFAPLEQLGVIVVDEEQDAAYKNEEGFRYHARDLAARRAAAAACPLVLGSATPALETRFGADRGSLRRLVLPHRVGGRPLPAVEIIDLERERALLPRGRKLILSSRLHRALGGTLREGGQAILFLNRRGFSTRIFCFECGHAERCKNCEISLVYHAGDERLRCHYCDFSIPPSESCSSCGADGTALLGLGTERVEEEVRLRFPEARIERLDRDTATRRGGVERLLRRLAQGRIDILIGTQMVAKGHHFPGVRLVGVIVAELGLHLPDFRAAERTFQLLTQVAGRAGRGPAPGRVLVQTFAPDHYAVRPVRDHDYESFYREELSYRAELGYPPFGRLVRALVSGPEAEEAERAAQELAERAKRAVAGPAEPSAPGLERLEILGPAPAPIRRLRGRFRFHLLVKGTDAEKVLAAGRALAQGSERSRGRVRVHVDPSPMNML
jgi:primosomal protein N' (replication factor Y)